MTNLVTTPDFPKLIEIVDYEMNRKGVYICYNLFGDEQTIDAGQQEAAEMFKQAGYIKNHAGRGEALRLQVEVAYAGVDASGEYNETSIAQTITWAEFAMTWTLNKRMALELAVMKEREKSGTASQIFLTVLSSLKRSSMQEIILTDLEKEAFKALATVGTKTIWGLTIAQVHAAPDPVMIRALLVELRCQAKEDPYMMKHILGDEIFESLIKL